MTQVNEIYNTSVEVLRDTEQKLEKALEAMFEREQFYTERRIAAAEAEHRYKIKRAVETKKADGTIKDKEMTAEIACDVELLERVLTDAQSDIAKEKLLDVRTAVSARQSILNAETKRSV